MPMAPETPAGRLSRRFWKVWEKTYVLIFFIFVGLNILAAYRYGWAMDALSSLAVAENPMLMPTALQGRQSSVGLGDRKDPRSTPTRIHAHFASTLSFL